MSSCWYLQHQFNTTLFIVVVSFSSFSLLYNSEKRGSQYLCCSCYLIISSRCSQPPITAAAAFPENRTHPAWALTSHACLASHLDGCGSDSSRYNGFKNVLIWKERKEKKKTEVEIRDKSENTVLFFVYWESMDKPWLCPLGPLRQLTALEGYVA